MRYLLKSLIDMALVGLFLMITACGGNEKKRDAHPAGVITTPGVYKCGQYHLEVSVTADKLLDYALKTESGEQAAKSLERASIYQRWCLYWDDDARELWMYSGDVGIFVWAPGPDAKYQRTLVSDETPKLIKKMPERFFAQIGDTLRRRFALIREKS